ncbi:FHA domain-containing protein [bacterium]|nr:FHA domain-containing protein [bacterium]
MDTHFSTNDYFRHPVEACGTPWVDESMALSRGQNPSLRKALPTSGWLLGLNGVHMGEDLRLYPGTNTIGSSARCHVVVTAPETGRQHAVIDVVSGESAILQPGSTHRPLFLNGEPCEKASPLCHGDVIQIGEQLFAYIPLLPVPSTTKQAIVFNERPTVNTPCTVGWLFELNGRSQGRDFRLFLGNNVIGNQPGVEVLLPDEQINPRHCIITRHTENWTIVPVAVTDVLHVNGVPTSGTGLENGDIIKVGTCEFMFRCVKVAFAK